MLELELTEPSLYLGVRRGRRRPPRAGDLGAGLGVATRGCPEAWTTVAGGAWGAIPVREAGGRPGHGRKGASRSAPLRDLRISVTDRCNFRCVYCMPKEVFGRDYQFLGREELLTFEEIERIARAFVAGGVEKIRITGGEPLLRRDLRCSSPCSRRCGDAGPHADDERRAARAQARGARRGGPDPRHGEPRLARRRRLPGDERRRLPRRARARRNRRGRGGGPRRSRSTSSSSAAQRGSILDLARRFNGAGHTLRFIEYMDVGHTNGWRLDDVVPAAEIVARSTPSCRSSRSSAGYRGEVAQRYRYRDGSGEIGVIASVTQPFCGDCTRARLSADGKLYTCLFAVRGHDLRALVRWARSDEELPPRSPASGSVARPLLRAPNGRDRRPAQGRDVLHRRLTAAAPTGRLGRLLAGRSRRRGRPVFVAIAIRYSPRGGPSTSAQQGCDLARPVRIMLVRGSRTGSCPGLRRTASGCVPRAARSVSSSPRSSR